MSYIRTIYARFYNFILYFIAYSFIGWLIETFYLSVKTGGFVKRGFLEGPFCPVYGFCAIFLLLTLRPFRYSFASVLTVSILITSLLEYVTGFLLDFFFNYRLWDYSDEFLNIHGWVCLKFTLIWALFSILLLYVLHPQIEKYLKIVPLRYKTAMSSILSVYFIADTAVSVLSSTHLIENINFLGRI